MPDQTTIKLEDVPYIPPGFIANLYQTLTVLRCHFEDNQPNGYSISVRIGQDLHKLGVQIDGDFRCWHVKWQGDEIYNRSARVLGVDNLINHLQAELLYRGQLYIKEQLAAGTVITTPVFKVEFLSPPEQMK